MFCRSGFLKAGILTLIRAQKRSVSFAAKEDEVIPPPPPTTTPPDEDDTEEEESPPLSPGPDFTLQREEGKLAQKHLQHEFIKNIIAEYLQIHVKDLKGVLTDGVMLCQLLNEMKKNSVRMIHTKQAGNEVPKLKAVKNMEAFTRCSRMLGVPKERLCSTSDIQQEEMGPIYDTLRILVDKFPSSN